MLGFKACTLGWDSNVAELDWPKCQKHPIGRMCWTVGPIVANLNLFPRDPSTCLGSVWGTIYYSLEG